MQKKIIQINNLSKTYVTKKNEISALNNVNVSFEKGKFYAIMGPSGSGKSTLIKILGMLLNFEKGKYIFDGKDVHLFTDNEICKIRAKRIGFVFQEYYLCETLNARENVSLPMVINKTIPKSSIKNHSENLLKKMKLGHRINHFPKEMSGGSNRG